MQLDPLLHASWLVVIHVGTLLAAWLIGTWLLFVSRKGDKFHRAIGKLFLILITLTAAVAFFIPDPGSHFHGLGPLHYTVPLALLFVGLAWAGARTHRLSLHRFGVFGLYFGSLMFTAVVNIFLGNGIAHQIFFGQ